MRNRNAEIFCLAFPSPYWDRNNLASSHHFFIICKSALSIIGQLIKGRRVKTRIVRQVGEMVQFPGVPATKSNIINSIIQPTWQEITDSYTLSSGLPFTSENKQKRKIKQNDELSFLIDEIKIIVANYNICIHMSIISDIWVINEDGILHNGHNFLGSFIYRVNQDLESDDMRGDV